MWQVHSRPRALCLSLAWGMSTTCFGATKSAGRGRGRGRWSGGAILWDSVVRGAHIVRSYFHECFLMVPLQTLISCIFGYAWVFSFDRKCIWYPVKAVPQRGWLETKWLESVEDGWLVEWPVVEWLARSILEGRSTNGWSWSKEVGSAARNWGTKRVKGIDGTGWNSPWDWKCTHLFFFHAGWQQPSSQCEPTALTRAPSSSTLWRQLSGESSEDGTKGGAEATSGRSSRGKTASRARTEGERTSGDLLSMKSFSEFTLWRFGIILKLRCSLYLAGTTTGSWAKDYWSPRTREAAAFGRGEPPTRVAEENGGRRREGAHEKAVFWCLLYTYTL